MPVKIILFGTLSEIIQNKGRLEIDSSSVKDTEELKDYLNQKYPLLSKTTYTVAVSKNIVKEKTMLKEGDEVALLPPYAGG